MKKVLLTAMALITIASASAFGMYGNSDGWIDFLVHGNQLRARMDQLGFTLGNGTIKGTFGFKADTGSYLGSILSATTGDEANNPSKNGTSLNATISAGIGYTSPVFGIGVGYSYTWVDKERSIHTPVLAINALNDNLRIAIPVQIAVGDKDVAGGINQKDYMGIRTDVQIRYYTGIDAFNAIRFYLKYGQQSYNNGLAGTLLQEYSASSLDLRLRLYFLNTTIGNVGINPYVQVSYATALEGDNIDVSSYDALNNEKGTKYGNYKFAINPTLGITANSDVVSLYVEPSIGYALVGNGKNDADESYGMTHNLTWGAYTELYITPVKDLEFYFEMDIGSKYYSANGASAVLQNNEIVNRGPINFATGCGITWYLPSLNGAE
ncbi:cell surface protein [Brachyspira pulli]|uniref:cell surface protein n=1 Tax=Brachyspira pulli TaxID=310721 RepID=UPI0030053D8C